MSDPHLQVRFRRPSMSLVPIPDCHIRSCQKGQDLVTVLTPRLLEIARSAVAYKKSYPPIRRPTSQPRDPPSTAKPNCDRQRHARMISQESLNTIGRCPLHHDPFRRSSILWSMGTVTETAIQLPKVHHPEPGNDRCSGAVVGRTDQSRSVDSRSEREREKFLYQ